MTPQDQHAKAEREAFEVWADDQGFKLQPTVHGDDYQDLRTQGPWEAWQARAALASSPSPGVPEGLSVDAVEDEVGMGAGAWDMVAPEEIIAAVLKLAASHSGSADSKDAERYRFLRENDAPTDTLLLTGCIVGEQSNEYPSLFAVTFLDPEELDKAVDAAIKEGNTNV